MKCAHCGRRNRVRDLEEYFSLKDKSGKRLQFCSLGCLYLWAYNQNQLRLFEERYGERDQSQTTLEVG